MGVYDIWKSVKSIFSDPEENCFLNSSADISETFQNGKLALHEWAWIATGIATAIAIALSAYLIYKHCRNYTSKYQQRFIIRILLMVPIYACDSFISFRLYNIAIYFDLVRDCYEAFVINTFFCLLIEYTGGYEKTKEAFAKNERIKLIFPLNCIHVRPKRGLLRTLKRITLQYVVIRPLTALAAVILQSVNLYCPGNWNFSRGYIYLTAILFVSVTAAMYALIMFYALARHEMAKYKPIGKFLSVKFVIFLSFWQSILVAGLVYLKVFQATSGWSTDNISDGVQNVLICGEMLIVSIVHIYVFSYTPYVKEDTQTSVLRSLKLVFSPFDIARDVKYSFFPYNRKKVRKSKKHVELEEVSVDNLGVPKPATSSPPDSPQDSSPNSPSDSPPESPELQHREPSQKQPTSPLSGPGLTL